MTKDVLVVYHSADYDGLFCREVARNNYGDTAEYIGWNFGDAPLDYPSGKTVYVLDLPCDRVFNLSMESLAGMSGLIWIDHHKTSMDTHPKSINGYRIDGVAACRLAWQWFSGNRGVGGRLPNKEEYVSRKISEPLALRLAGEYDIFDKRDPNAELFQHGLRSRELTSECWGGLLGTDDSYAGMYLQAGIGIQYVCDREYAQVIKEQGFTFKWEGLTFLGCNSHRLDIRSHLFAAGIKPEHQALFGFTYVGGKWSVSMYHAPGHEQHDLSAIAKKHNGGGHRGACGMILDTLPFLQ